MNHTEQTFTTETPSDRKVVEALDRLFDQAPSSVEVNGAPRRAEPPALPQPSLISLEELLNRPPRPEMELLRNRFLCRQGTMLLIGQTGIGKSTLISQMIVRWGSGKKCVGIEPSQPLRSLIYNGENDDEDLVEMYRPALEAPDMSPEDRALALQNVRSSDRQAMSGDDFILQLTADLQSYPKDTPPDLVWIDPALHFAGCNASEQEAVGAFLRVKLKSLANTHKCAFVLVLHTPKPPRDASAYDLSYIGFGSAEWSNFSRAILHLGKVEEDVFMLTAPKRGNRLGWKDESGKRVFSKPIRWSREDGISLWIEATAEEVIEAKASRQSKNRGREPSPQEVLGLFPKADDGSGILLKTTEIKERFVVSGWDKNLYLPKLDQLVREGELRMVTGKEWGLATSGKAYGRKGLVDEAEKNQR